MPAKPRSASAPNGGSPPEPADIDLPDGELAEDDGSGDGTALRRHLAEMRHDPAAIRQIFETGEYPYRTRLRTSMYRPTCWRFSANC